MAENQLYGVKLVCRYAVGEDVFYEERVLRVRADSFDDAIEKASRYAETSLENGRVNMYGQSVEERVCESMNCYLIDENEAGIEETYSSIMKNQTKMPEEAFLDLLTGGCEREEMKALRSFHDPDEAEMGVNH